MTSIFSKPAVDPLIASGAAPADFAARLGARLPALVAAAEHGAAVSDVVRDANAHPTPRGVAEWLIGWAQAWIPAPCWAVVVRDADGSPRILASVGLVPALEPSLHVVADWVLQHGAEFSSADLSVERRTSAATAGSVLSFPLVCRSRTEGALIGLDCAPSATPPGLGRDASSLVRRLLQPGAIALQNALALQRAEALAVTDDLTRLFNARYLNLALRRETKRASRTGRPLSLLFIDLDGFKRVNDAHGHLVGSRALAEAAGILVGSARESDVATRFGGDEFAIILPDTGSDGAVMVATRIRDRFRACRLLEDEGYAIRLTTSIGVATLPDVATSAEELLRAADAAMYKVKAAGKDGIHVIGEADGR